MKFIHRKIGAELFGFILGPLKQISLDMGGTIHRGVFVSFTSKTSRQFESTASIARYEVA